MSDQDERLTKAVGLLAEIVTAPPSPPVPAVSVAEMVEAVEMARRFLVYEGNTVKLAECATRLSAAAATLRKHEEAVSILRDLVAFDQRPLAASDIDEGNAIMDRAAAFLASTALTAPADPETR